MKANEFQIGGEHYKDRIQHWDVYAALPYAPSTASKYLHRWRKKGGIEDLHKSLHYLTKAVEEEIQMPKLTAYQRRRFEAYCKQLNSSEANANYFIILGEFEEAINTVMLMVSIAENEKGYANPNYVDQD